MNAISRTGSHAVQRIVGAVVVVAVVVAMLVSTNYINPSEAAQINPPPFNGATYASDNFAKFRDTISKDAVDLSKLAPVADGNIQVAGQRFGGTNVGGTGFTFKVKATGTVESLNDAFAVITVPDMPEGDTVRIPRQAALTGTAIRDAAGVTFGDFTDQTEYQTAATQIGLYARQQVVQAADLPSLKGKQVTVTGAWSSGGAPKSYIIQPVSIEAAAS